MYPFTHNTSSCRCCSNDRKYLVSRLHRKGEHVDMHHFIHASPNRYGRHATHGERRLDIRVVRLTTPTT